MKPFPGSLCFGTRLLTVSIWALFVVGCTTDQKDNSNLNVQSPNSVSHTGSARVSSNSKLLSLLIDGLRQQDDFELKRVQQFLDRLFTSEEEKTAFFSGKGIVVISAHRHHVFATDIGRLSAALGECATVAAVKGNEERVMEALNLMLEMSLKVSQLSPPKHILAIDDNNSTIRLPGQRGKYQIVVAISMVAESFQAALEEISSNMVTPEKMEPISIQNKKIREEMRNNATRLLSQEFYSPQWNTVLDSEIRLLQSDLKELRDLLFTVRITLI